MGGGVLGIGLTGHNWFGLVANSFLRFLFVGLWEVAQFTGETTGIMVFILRAVLFD